MNAATRRGNTSHGLVYSFEVAFKRLTERGIPAERAEKLAMDLAVEVERRLFFKARGCTFSDERSDGNAPAA